MSRVAKVTPEDIDTYRRDGAVVIRGALGPELRALLERGVEKAYRSLGAGTTVGDDMATGQTVVRDYASRDSAALQALLEDGVPGRVAAALMETDSAQLILDQIFYKQQGSIVPTPWHQDTPFLRVRGDQLVRLWMPCDHSPRDVTVQVVRGSHRWNAMWNSAVRGVVKVEGAAAQMSGAVGDARLPSPPDVARYRDSFDILSWDVAPGDILAFQGNMLHGADGHPGHDRPRRAFAVLMGGPELRYHKPREKAFPSPGRMTGQARDEDIPDGAPIGDYEKAFPRY